MKTTDRLKLHGRLIIRVLDAKTRRCLRTLDAKNMIVNTGFVDVLKLLGQTDASGSSLGLTLPQMQAMAISKLHIGTDATAPALGQTGLLADIFTLPSLLVETVTVTPPYLIVASTTLESTQANGNTLREAGLFTGAGVLFSRQIHSAVPKNEGLAVNYQWQIGIGE